MLPENINTSTLSTGIACTEFRTDPDLSRFTDSMLFDSHVDEIAYAEFPYKNLVYVIKLEISGYVRLDYKHQTFTSPSIFPSELKALIRENPNKWSVNSPDIDIQQANWFEYLVGYRQTNGITIYNNGIMLNDDVSQMTPQEIFDQMADIINETIFN